MYAYTQNCKGELMYQSFTRKCKGEMISVAFSRFFSYARQKVFSHVLVFLIDDSTHV